MEAHPDRTVIAGNLRKMRGRRRLLGSIIAAYIPGVVTLYLLQLPNPIILGTAIVLVCFGIGLAFAIGLTSCPACGKPFHVRGMGGSIFTPNCMHCGIALKQQ